jgi:hypothetical protein
MDDEARLMLLRRRREAGGGVVTEEFKRKEKEMIDTMRAMRVIKETTQACPKCGVPVEKSAGCNKMACANCDAYFCFACGKDITDVKYDHFGADSCVLFDEQAVKAWEAQVGLEMDPMGRFDYEAPLWAGGLWQEGRNGGAGGRGAGGAGHGERIDWRNQRRPAAQCPGCRQMNVKEKRNNHMKCRTCGYNYCFLCRRLVKHAAKHYIQGNGAGCRQHTD